MMSPGPSSVALYARVSSDQQAKEQTIASQVAVLRERIRQDGHGLPLEFLDEGFSGGTLLRPGLEKLRDRVAEGLVEKLYLLAPDRLSRKYAYQVLLLDEFQRAKVEVIFLNHAIGKSPEDDLLLQVQGMISEYERVKILERARRGRLHAARQGSVSVLHSAPYGYRYVSRARGDGQAALVVHAAEAEIVRRIFRWVVEDRCTIGEVVRRLQQANVLSPKGKTRWSRGTLASLLKNSTYRGRAVFGKSRSGEPRERLRPSKGQPLVAKRPGSRYATEPSEQIEIAAPALVSAEVFAAVAEQMGENRKKHREGKRGAKYLLQGLIECAQCGHAFYGKPVTSVYRGRRSHYTYYRCVGCEPYRTGGEKLCRNRQVRTDRLEDGVWQDVIHLLGDPRRLQEEAERRYGQPREKRDEGDRIRDQIRRTKAGLGKVMDAYENGLIERPEWEERMTRLRLRLAEFEQQRAEAEAEANSGQRVEEILAEWRKFAERVNAGIDQADWSTKRAILRALIKRVEVDEGEIRIIYRVPPTPYSQTQGCGSLPDCRDNAQPSSPTK